MRIFVLNLLFFFIFHSLSAEKRCTISGFIKDSVSGEELIGATIKFQNTYLGCVTNDYGYYSFSVPTGEYTIVVSYIGYKSIKRKVILKENIRWDIDMTQKVDLLDEVNVITNSSQKQLKSSYMGVNSIEMSEIRNIPVIFGEQDILKTIQLMPGVKPAGEAFNGFYVRGGSNDQNLILLDDAPIYNASHLLGFFSVFNSDAIKNARLIKGSAPAKYGGRLSSVLDIKMKNGNIKQFAGSGGIGLIASRLTLETPIKKEKGSIIVSGRRTYADLFLKMSSKSDIKDTELYFYDLNIKANYKFGHKDRLYISSYIGQDVFSYNNAMDLKWGNRMITLRWNHIFNDKIFMNTTILYSNYNYNMTDFYDYEYVDISSGIDDNNIKFDFQYFMNSSNTIRFGVNVINHNFSPGNVEFSGNDNSENDKRLLNRKAWETSVYLSNEFRLGNNINIDMGLRFSDIRLMGGGEYSLYDEEGNKYNTENYGKDETVKYFSYLEPRFSINLNAGDNSAVKASYSRNIQYMHIVSNTGGGSPFDIWYPVSRMVKPQKAMLYSLGYFRNFNSGMYEMSLETYYKDMYNQIEYKNGADIFMNEDIDGELVFGKARSYGLEFLLRKNRGSLSGWVSYTLSRIEKQFDKINNGNWFLGRQDRLHDISIVMMYKLSERIEISSNWLYYTGDAVTFPSGKYQLANNVVNLYAERNANRMPNYHRLDLGLIYNMKTKGHFRSWWTFSLYNAYGRDNAFMMYFRKNKDNHSVNEAVKISLFSVVPSISWNFQF